MLLNWLESESTSSFARLMLYLKASFIPYRITIDFSVDEAFRIDPVKRSPLLCKDISQCSRPVFDLTFFI